ATAVFGRQDFVSIGAILQTTVVGVLIPLAFGLAIQAVAPGLAARWWSRIYKISMLLVVLAFLPIIVKVWPALMSLVGNGTLVVMAVMALVTLLVGRFLGGPDLRDRATLAIASSVRHPGIAMATAATFFHDPRVSAAILLYLLVGLIVSIPYTAWIKHA